MAGSYKHVVKKDGNLRSNKEVVESLENGGDVFEAVEEMYGMIWYLANQAIFPDHPIAVKAIVEEARQSYKEGLEIAKEVNS